MVARQIRLNVTIGVGGAALLFALVGSFVLPTGASVAGSLVWIGFGVLPLYVVGVWLARRRPDHPQAWRLLLGASASAVGVAFEQVVGSSYSSPDSDGWLLWVNLIYQEISMVILITIVLLFATYPDGIVERRWQSIVVRTSWCWLALPPLLLLTSPTLVIDPYLLSPLPTVPNPFAVAWLTPLAPALELVYISYPGGIAAMAVLFARYLESSTEQRRRMRLLVYTIAAGIPILLAGFVMKLVGVPQDAFVLRVVESLYLPILVMIPVSIVIGVMRYRMYEIDIIVRRSVVFGVLSAGIVIIYVALVVAPGLALGDQIPVQLAVVITIAAALAFQPLRRRLEALADRWVFGKRVNRYQLLTDFGTQLEATVGLADLLPRLAGAVQQGLRAPWVRVSVPGSSAVAGEPAGRAELTVPLERPGDRPGISWTVQGTIECGSKPGGYEPGDQELLTTLAGQASTAIANVRLTAELGDRLDELERSRARIVAAQDVERRRIERNIHDGVQQELVAMMMKIRLARNQVGRGERTPNDAFDELQQDTKELLADLRELAHGIHPPVLSDGGLVAAVEARAARLPFDVRLISAPTLRSRRFAEDVEGAAYFVVCEALTNVLKHSAATRTEVTLSSTPGRLSVRVHDDGAGFARTEPAGSGLTNLRDRVEALGGRFGVETAPGMGTLISADLPVAANGRGPVTSGSQL